MGINLPYPVTGTVYESDGTTAVSSGVSVTARNETTNELISTTTNSSGQYVLDYGNFSSGYLSSDTVTTYVLYTTFEASSSIVISSNTHTLNLTLADVSASNLVKYCTVQDVWDYLDGIGSTDISAARVIKEIRRAEAQIEQKTGQKFTSTSVSQEVYDFNQYTTWYSPEMLEFPSVANIRSDYQNLAYRDRIRLKNFPVLSVTTLQRNLAAANQTDSWETLTQNTGSGGDFLIDLNTGYIDFVEDKPRYGKRAMRVTYTYGYSAVPKTVEKLTILLAVKSILMTKMAKSQFDSTDSITLAEISIRKGAAEGVRFLEGMKMEVNELWEQVGTYSTLI